MSTHFKSRYTLGALVLLIAPIITSLLFLLSIGPDPLKSSVILQSPLAPSSPYTLIYNTPDLSKVVGYDFTPTTSLPQSSSIVFTPYTEGFLPEDLTTSILDLLKVHVPLNKSYFHDYYFDNGIHYIAFSGGLDQLFAVDTYNNSVRSFKYAEEDDLGNMYVSSMQTVDDQLVIAGAKAHSYDLLVYTFDKDTLSLTSRHSITAPPKVMNNDHFFLTPDGILYFLGDKQNVISYNPFTRIEESIPIAFTGDYILSYQDSFIAIQHKDAMLYVDSPLLERPLSFSLPSLSSIPISYIYTDDYLIGIFFDSYGKQFSNYVSIYHLPSNSWVYLLGIESHKQLSLTDILYTN